MKTRRARMRNAAGREFQIMLLDGLPAPQRSASERPLLIRSSYFFANLIGPSLEPSAFCVFGQRSSALAVMISWSRFARVRSDSGIASIFAVTSFSPAALFLFARASSFRSLARSFMAARSSSVNPCDVLSISVALKRFLTFQSVLKKSFLSKVLTFRKGCIGSNQGKETFFADRKTALQGRRIK